MIFTTWTFAAFMLLAWLAYWLIVPPRYRRQALVALGVVFYAFSVPAYLAVIATLGAVTLATGRAMLGASERGRSRLLAAGCVAIAGTLGWFKYAHFLALTVDQVAARRVVPLPQIVVPLAISFFTFEFVHVLADVRAGTIARLGALDFATFTLFFPTLVAGPIKRYQSFARQLARIVAPPRPEMLRHAYRVCIGVFKKLVVADSLGVLTQPLVAPGPPAHRLDSWVAVLAYAGKIYFDFSGYSDIAIGTAGLLGIAIPENFDRPYRARDIQEFWRRWHVSLSTWIRDYLFVPLGGSRRPAPVVALNLLLVMVVAGLWHGAAWTFVLWGLWHGAGLAAHRTWARALAPRLRPYARRVPARLAAAASVAATFVFVALGWVLFAATSLQNAGAVYRSLFTG